MWTHMDFYGHYNLLECWGLHMHFYGDKLQNWTMLGRINGVHNNKSKVSCNGFQGQRRHFVDSYRLLWTLQLIGMIRTTHAFLCTQTTKLQNARENQWSNNIDVRYCFED